MPALRRPPTCQISDPTMSACFPLPHVLRQYHARAKGLPDRKQLLISLSTFSRLCLIILAGVPFFPSSAFAISSPVGESSVNPIDRLRSCETGVSANMAAYAAAT